MATHNALVLVNGKVQQMPAGDTLNGASGGSSTVSYATLASDVVVTTQAETDLISFSGEANKTYLVTALIDFLSTNTAGATGATFTVPSGGSMRLQIFTNSTTGNAAGGNTAGTFYGNTSTSSLSGIVTVNGLIRIGATAGTVTLRVRKNSATAGTLTWYAGSGLIIHKIN